MQYVVWNDGRLYHARAVNGPALLPVGAEIVEAESEKQAVESFKRGDHIIERVLAIVNDLDEEGQRDILRYVIKRKNTLKGRSQ